MTEPGYLTGLVGSPWMSYDGHKAKLPCFQWAFLAGASGSLSWTDERTKALDEIKKLEPDDRLGLYASLIKMNSALFESVRGWDAWLRNPSFINTFTQEELKEIFKQFKDVCVQFLEEDVRWTGKKEKNLPAGSKVPKSERAEAERRYA